ncbi:velvet factor, partial [Mycotypha africana]|uniref:velvet factor n=1 Tax=Mycotypha africana TaxID=64632 RepID=UPI0023004F5D
MNHDIPPPFKLSKPSQLDRKYSLSVVQNPIRARCCGFGEKDRRPIDPPPILQLTAKNSFGEAIDLKPEDSVLFLVQCELYNEDMTENRTLVYTPWSTNQQQHNDNDLSVRTEGIFTLKFVFIDLAFGEPLRKTTQIQQTVFSSTFQVYPAKKFPGLTESTSLSRCFSKQGIKIPIRNDSPYKRI